jgi:Ring finger domain
MSLVSESTNTNLECPICYDEIDQLKNCVTTDCGHIFHCSCLMKNAVNNGFSCPMCRNIMAEELESDTESDTETDNYYDELSTNSNQDENNALTSFRMFHQQLDGEEVELEPEPEDEEEHIEEVTMVKPSLEFIAAKLLAQGITMIDLIKCLLLDHEEYDEFSVENETKSDQIFGSLRILISNYPRQSQTEIDRHEKAAEVYTQVTTEIVQTELA